ncbi:MAG: polysaccharide deacetylase family protein [Myxococcota bacterium]
MARSLAERLGFSSEDCVAVVHCDDLGMCHAANLGAYEALDHGPASSGSVMVPCPWFQEAADMARARPEVDLGVHLTLTAEWPHYRWGPVAGASAVPSLLDDQGYLPRTAAETARRARPEEATREMRAQIERALAAGIDVTHLDAHMGTAFLAPFIDGYVELALEFALPVLAVRPTPAMLAMLGDADAGRTIAAGIERLERAGVPIFDGLDADSLSFAPGAGEAHNRARLDAIAGAPGVHYLICHPARGGEELDAIAPEAHARDFERRFYGGAAGRRAIEERGIRTVGMRALRDLLRDGAGA